MKKKYFNLILALTIVAAGMFGTKFDSCAETEGLKWDVTYTGKGFDSTYDIKNATIENALPGDVVNYKIDYINNSGEEAAFYMNADIVKTLEDGSKASGGAYSYKILNSNSEKPIIDSETIGGDATTAIGLDQANGKKGAYFSLGKLADGKSGTVTIEIALDGNTQNNSYMSTLGKINVQFGAEATKTGPVTIYNHVDRVNVIDKVIYRTIKETKTVPRDKTIEKTLDNGTEVVVITDDEVPLSGEKKIKNIINKPGTTIADDPVPLAGGTPKTGDSIVPLAICLIMMVAGIVLIVWYFKLAKNKNKEEA